MSFEAIREVVFLRALLQEIHDLLVVQLYMSKQKTHLKLDITTCAITTQIYLFPFVIIREWKEKVNLVDDDLEDTITYSAFNTWYFLKDRSSPLTGDEIVVVPHLPALVSFQPVLNFFYLVVNMAGKRIHSRNTLILCDH